VVRISINLKGARNKLSQRRVDRGTFALSNQALADMNPFVPMKDGIARQTGHVYSGGKVINWNTPYINKLFYMHMYNYTTPGTGPRWDLKAKPIFINDWIEAFKRGADW
jgi:hypothetical protein